VSKRTHLASPDLPLSGECRRKRPRKDIFFLLFPFSPFPSPSASSPRKCKKTASGFLFSGLYEVYVKAFKVLLPLFFPLPSFSAGFSGAVTGRIFFSSRKDYGRSTSLLPSLGQWNSRYFRIRHEDLFFFLSPGKTEPLSPFPSSIRK